MGIEDDDITLSDVIGARMGARVGVSEARAVTYDAVNFASFSDKICKDGITRRLGWYGTYRI